MRQSELGAAEVRVHAAQEVAARDGERAELDAEVARKCEQTLLVHGKPIAAIRGAPEAEDHVLDHARKMRHLAQHVVRAEQKRLEYGQVRRVEALPAEPIRHARVQSEVSREAAVLNDGVVDAAYFGQREVVAEGNVRFAAAQVEPLRERDHVAHGVGAGEHGVTRGLGGVRERVPEAIGHDLLVARRGDGGRGRVRVARRLRGRGLGERVPEEQTREVHILVFQSIEEGAKVVGPCVRGAVQAGCEGPEVVAPEVAVPDLRDVRGDVEHRECERVARAEGLAERGEREGQRHEEKRVYGILGRAQRRGDRVGTAVREHFEVGREMHLALADDAKVQEAGGGLRLRDRGGYASLVCGHGLCFGRKRPGPRIAPVADPEVREGAPELPDAGDARVQQAIERVPDSATVQDIEHAVVQRLPAREV